MQHLASILSDAAQQYGDQIALVIGTDEFSFIHLDALSNQVASGLVANGVSPGDRVTLYGANAWEWVVSYYGILKAGAVVNPINVMLTPEEVEFVVEDCGAKAIIASREKGLPLVERLSGSGIDSLILYGDDIPDGAIAFETMLAHGSEQFEAVLSPPESLSTICYTSGTTGKPKGAMLSHRAVATNIAMTGLMHGRNSSDVVVTALPCPHVYGNVVMNAMFQCGGKIVIHPLFDPGEMLASMQAHKATIFDGVPTMYMFMLNHPKVGKFDLSSLRLCTVGGQPMPPAKMREVEERFGCPLIELWGMTELAGLGTTFAWNGEYRHGSIGVAIPYVSARIVDVDDASKEMPAGEVGELMIRGAIVMDGYFGNEKATQETIEPDGWLHTGDLATMDRQGNISIVDRKKDMILTAGYNVYPAEIERVLATHPDVALAAVGSVADELKGELAKAYVIPKEGCSPSEEDIIAYCREHLAAYKVPRAVQFVADVPKTSTGKIMRRELHTLDVSD
ncbi:class I adenylate-forming enzyme family protein [Litorivivens sp.]|uniref:class I adenylate-forming enzyme family protein n=2 Tax=Litorivivens sp. TaxID=2020868 RepID=UPI00356A4504